MGIIIIPVSISYRHTHLPTGFQGPLQHTIMPRIPDPAVYFCIRFRVRRTQLLQPEQCMRLASVSVPQGARCMSEHGYGREVLVIGA